MSSKREIERHIKQVQKQWKDILQIKYKFKKGISGVDGYVDFCQKNVYINIAIPEKGACIEDLICTLMHEIGHIIDYSENKFSKSDDNDYEKLKKGIKTRGLKNREVKAWRNAWEILKENKEMEKHIKEYFIIFMIESMLSYGMEYDRLAKEIKNLR